MRCCTPYPTTRASQVPTANGRCHTPGGQVLPVAIRSVHSVATTLFEQSQPRGKGQVLIASPRPAARRQALVLGQLRQHWQPKPSTPVQTHHMTLPTRLDPEVINPDQTLGFQPSVGQTMLQVHQDASRSSLDKRSSWATALRCSSSRANIIRTELTCPRIASIKQGFWFASTA